MGREQREFVIGVSRQVGWIVNWCSRVPKDKSRSDIFKIKKN